LKSFNGFIIRRKNSKLSVCKLSSKLFEKILVKKSLIAQFFNALPFPAGIVISVEIKG